MQNVNRKENNIHYTVNTCENVEVGYEQVIILATQSRTYPAVKSKT